MIYLRLRTGAFSGRRLVLRELCGHDERAASTPGQLSGVDLLGRLMISAGDEWVGPDHVRELPLGERDRALAEVYRVAFDDRVEGHVDCVGGCAKPFEFGFALRGLEQSLASGSADLSAELEGPDGAGAYRAGALRFRLPDTRDVEAVRVLPGNDPGRRLAERCLIDGDVVADAVRLGELITKIAPVLDVTVPATCPECSTPSQVRFEIQRFLLRALAQEGVWLTREVHVLACAYGWSRDTILGLTRTERRDHVRLVELDQPARRRRVA